MTANKKSIAVIDSGVANLASVLAALRRIGVDAAVTADAAAIRAASHVILPGVGAASAAMARLEAKKLVETIRGLTQPVLGICLGMQLLFAVSEEGRAGDAVLPCLGVIPGMVRRMIASRDMPVPHMGWNQLKLLRPNHALLRGVEADSFVYFVHSYAAPVSDASLATADYNGVFTSIVAYKNFFGCQFHPERSGAIGGRILQNFVEM
jgi:imidazole glycerol-phosphate synthase subunit HisH